MRLFLAALLALTLLPAAARAATKPKALPDARATAHIVGKLTQSGHVHGLVVGFVSPAGRATYGFGRFGEGRDAAPPDGRTLFEIGSITKTFTGQMLAQAVMVGRLRVTDPMRL